jgi:hypothetical protein
MLKFSIIFSLCFVVFLNSISYSQDRIFARTYQSLTLPKGAKDIEFWNTVNVGRANLYRKLKQRVEYEVGVTDNLTAAFYMNLQQKIQSENGNSTLEATELSFSNEWKYKLMDPVADPIGFALYSEYTIAAHELELELKLILDKKIGDNYFALNATYEPEWEWSLANNLESVSLKSGIDFNVGYMNFVSKNFGIGLEAINYNTIAKGELDHSALFIGPTFTFIGDRWWVILNALPQITKLYASQEVDKSRSLILTEREKFEFRMIFSVNLQ